MIEPNVRIRFYVVYTGARKELAVCTAHAPRDEQGTNLPARLKENRMDAHGEYESYTVF